MPYGGDEIAAEVARCSAHADHVFTTGGVGPTHDDMTLEGIASAFALSTHWHPKLEQLLREKSQGAPTEAALGMAEIPEESELWWGGELFFPVIVVRNVHIFPGVPALFQRKFLEVAHRFGGVPVQTRRLVTEERESVIAARLGDAQQRWPQVAIGSYPQFERRPWTVTITMDSRDEEALAACHAQIRAAVDTSES